MTDEPVLRENPSQTAGPYLHIGCSPNQAGIASVFPVDLLQSGACEDLPELQSVTVRVLDGQGMAVSDAMVEAWVAPYGYWYRSVYDEALDAFAFELPKPGYATGEQGEMSAPHVMLWVVARGINLGLFTRMYFADDDHASDEVLNRVDKERRNTLIAECTENGYAFDIHLQGDQETVFFDV